MGGRGERPGPVSFFLMDKGLECEWVCMWGGVSGPECKSCGNSEQKPVRAKKGSAFSLNTNQHETANQNFRTEVT